MTNTTPEANLFFVFFISKQVKLNWLLCNHAWKSPTHWFQFTAEAETLAQATKLFAVGRQAMYLL